VNYIHNNREIQNYFFNNEYINNRKNQNYFYGNKSDGDTRMTILYTRFVTQHELKICGKNFFWRQDLFWEKILRKSTSFDLLDFHEILMLIPPTVWTLCKYGQNYILNCNTMRIKNDKIINFIFSKFLKKFSYGPFNYRLTVYLCYWIPFQFHWIPLLFYLVQICLIRMCPDILNLIHYYIISDNKIKNDTLHVGSL
jgi:hypothetical protein